jgi:hypothetical protein
MKNLRSKIKANYVLPFVFYVNNPSHYAVDQKTNLKIANIVSSIRWSIFEKLHEKFTQ